MIKYTLLLIVLIVEVVKAMVYTLFEFLWDFNCTVEHFKKAIETVKYIRG